MDLKPCKELDYETKFIHCELKEVKNFPGVKYWERDAVMTDNGQNSRDVQFCKRRGRINNIFDCYEKGNCHDYEPLVPPADGKEG